MPAFTLVVMETLAHESGQSERIAEWVRDHGGVVRGYVRAMVARNDLVDDLVQEVFFRAWQGRAGYEERGRRGPTCCKSPIAWCATGIAARSRKRRSAIECGSWAN